MSVLLGQLRALRALAPAVAGALGLAMGLGLAASPAAADAIDEADPSERPAAQPLVIDGELVAPGSIHRFSLAASESFAGAPVEIPIVAIHGYWAGPTLCLSAGVHGDEINGVESVRRALEEIDVATLRGTVLAVPIVNLHGFRRGSRYLPDRRDLNRYFPGRERGSAASRIAHVVFDGFVRRCDAMLDFHTGSFQRANLPHVRGDLGNPGVRALAEGLGGWLVLDHPGGEGTLRRAASDAGVPTLTFEVGGPYRVEPEAVARGVEGVHAILGHLGLAGAAAAGQSETVRRSRWVRVDDGGLLFTEVALGEPVAAGQRLGVVIDPITNDRGDILAPQAGRVIGMAWSQVVIPGFAAFHLAVAGETPGNGAGATEDHPGDGSPGEPDPEDRPE